MRLRHLIVTLNPWAITVVMLPALVLGFIAWRGA